MAPLTIYKASAGSGKTFQLTMAYLELLFKDPFAYRHILAVTFTNKAASEMKSRILERLYQISILKENDESEDLRLLLESTGLSKDKIIRSARDILVRVLNDYSRFSVGTIDRFFQGVIRAFTREIGLSAGFTLELDRDRILGEAIDRMFLDIGEDKALLDWLLRFAESRIEDARGWNFRNEIVNLGEELFSEAYQEIMLNDAHKISREDLDNFIKELKEKQDLAQDTVKEICKRKMQEMQTAGYTVDDFYRKGSGLAAFFEKAVNGDKTSLTDAQKAGISDISKWISKNEDDQNKIGFITTKLMTGLGQIYEQFIMLNTISQIKQYLFTLGILGDLAERILDITDEKNLFLLSDASRFLKGLIGNNPTPFIYEKTGNSIENIMLDEFQDTSVFQWDNFKPLIEHSLSIGKKSIVVGDVKQSIYRWRNSDWKILANIIEKSFAGYDIGNKTLKDNWRSSELLIRFNNTLFYRAPKIVGGIIDDAMSDAALDQQFIDEWKDLLDRAYTDIEQKIPDKIRQSQGYIKGEILKDDTKKFKELALEKIPVWIKELQSSGYTAGDIAILVRTNREGASVAKQLIEFKEESDNEVYNYNFVSNESLFLNNNSAIKFLVCLLSFFNDENDSLNQLSLKYYYQLVKQGSPEEISEALHPNKTLNEALGEHFMAQIPQLKRLPLFELVESLVALFDLDKYSIHLPYLQAFQEIMLELQQKEPGSLHDFLSFWKEYGDKKSITVSDQQDSIRIVTIHKAKGLEFKAVIIPFCDWDLASTGSGFNDTILWCDTAGTPFESLPVLPLKYKKAVGETLFAKKYFEELIMGYVDSMNILYVALTRAEEAMIIGLPESLEDGKIRKSGHLLTKAIESGSFSDSENYLNLAEMADEQGFIVGELGNKNPEVPAIDDTWIIQNYPVKLRSDQLRLRMKSSEYILNSESEAASHLDFGNIMHELFSMIETTSDIDSALGKFRSEGLLKDRDAEYLDQFIRERMSGPQVKDWFIEGMEIINERDIISEGESYRPDRVILKDKKAIVIDYKFGDQALPKYEKQLRKYSDLLKNMQYEEIETYLWYVMMNKVQRVE